jgi:hypothetical protein
MKTTDKKTVTVKFTRREADWLYRRLQMIRDTLDIPGSDYEMQQDVFMAKSLQDRIDSEE